jgi:hypothetical protein
MWVIGESVERKPGISSYVLKIISLLCNLVVTNVSDVYFINGNNSGCQQFEQWVYWGTELWDVREFYGTAEHGEPGV